MIFLLCLNISLSITDGLKKSTSGARVIFTTSLMAYLNILTTSAMKQYAARSPNKFMFLSYPISKFFQLSASETFSEKLKGLGITSNCFHPYAAKTNIFTSNFEGVAWYEYIILIIMFILSEISAKVRKLMPLRVQHLPCAYFWFT